jgi:hypothetical protein
VLGRKSVCSISTVDEETLPSMGEWSTERAL